MIDYKGNPWVNEGNHRIMVAHKLGWKFIPVYLRYFTGGELQQGPLTPEKVEKYHAAGLAAGYKNNNDYRGIL